MATQHERLAFNMHVRRALNVKRQVQRPFTLTETNLVEGKKLRSGTIIKDEKVNINKLDDEAFEFVSKDMLKTFKKNLVNKHKPAEMAMLQTFQERCAVCGQLFKSKRGLDSHLVKHTNVGLTCVLCGGRQFTAQIAFKKHLKWHRDGEKYYICELNDNKAGQKCGKKFEWPEWLNSHKLTHFPPSKRCRVHPGCEAIYTFDSERLKHERKGKCRKIYKCTACNTTFKDDINRHIHMGRYHLPTSKHYIKPMDCPQDHDLQPPEVPTCRKRQISSDKPPYGPTKFIKTASSDTRPTTTPPISRRNLSVNDPNLAIPLVPDLSSSSESPVDNTSSEYVPSTSMETDETDTLPDIA